MLMADLSPETRDAVREGAKRSAAVVLPIALDYLGNPRRLLEVGAGEGHWGHEAMRHGVHTLCMVDIDDSAPSVNRWDAEGGDKLPMDFEPDPDGYDERTGQTSGHSVKWPLALCLEMAEHVSPAAGDHLVSELCRVSEAVLWSAAIPGQGGDGHANEQWPEHWAKLFDAQGWTLGDEFRDALWMHPEVEPWYRQNLLLAIPADHPFILPGDLLPPRALVDPVTWAHHRGVYPPSVV